MGQATIEMIVVSFFIGTILVGGTLIILDSMGWLISARWAAMHSRCLALVTSENISCEQKIKQSLSKYFHFKNINLKTIYKNEIIHTEIKSQWLSKNSLKAKYDLLPSEYKRVSQ